MTRSVDLRVHLRPREPPRAHDAVDTGGGRPGPSTTIARDAGQGGIAPSGSAPGCPVQRSQTARPPGSARVSRDVLRCDGAACIPLCARSHIPCRRPRSRAVRAKPGTADREQRASVERQEEDPGLTIVQAHVSAHVRLQNRSPSAGGTPGARAASTANSTSPTRPYRHNVYCEAARHDRPEIRHG